MLPRDVQIAAASSRDCALLFRLNPQRDFPFALLQQYDFG